MKPEMRNKMKSQKNWKFVVCSCLLIGFLLFAFEAVGRIFFAVNAQSLGLKLSHRKDGVWSSNYSTPLEEAKVSKAISEIIDGNSSIQVGRRRMVRTDLNSQLVDKNSILRTYHTTGMFWDYQLLFVVENEVVYILIQRTSW